MTFQESGRPRGVGVFMKADNLEKMARRVVPFFPQGLNPVPTHKYDSWLLPKSFRGDLNLEATVKFMEILPSRLNIATKCL